jgi:hypothetical protein
MPTWTFTLPVYNIIRSCTHIDICPDARGDIKPGESVGDGIVFGRVGLAIAIEIGGLAGGFIFEPGEEGCGITRSASN